MVWLVINRIVTAMVPYPTGIPAFRMELTCIGCPPAELGVMLQ